MLLEIKNLSVSFNSISQPAVDKLNLSIHSNKFIGLVGESGCGKTLTALSILNLLQSPPASISGQIIFNNTDLLKLKEQELRKIRGNDISMIFQDPMTSLNPVYKVGHQIEQVLSNHKKLKKSELKKTTLDLLAKVQISSPEKRYYDYPHQMSGGMRQRVLIAMALACKPKLLIADEPTTALDVTIQAQILKLLNSLRQDMAVLLITHDLGVVYQFCSYINVMYLGSIVECGLIADIFNSPAHPYTKGLLKAVPHLGKRVQKLYTIKGSVPSLANIPKGCKFQNRCEYAIDICKKKSPSLLNLSDNHKVACWVAKDNNE